MALSEDNDFFVKAEYGVYCVTGTKTGSVSVYEVRNSESTGGVYSNSPVVLSYVRSPVPLFAFTTTEKSLNFALPNCRLYTSQASSLTSTL